MKKITLLIISFALSIFGNAQQTISFETSEGFSLGDINGQNGWVVTGCGENCFINNQEVSNTFATDGSNSFKISVDSAFGPQELIMGGFYDFSTPINYANATFSYDIYITNHTVNQDSDFRFGVTGEDSLGGLFFTFLIDFNYQNNIRIFENGGLITIGTWSNDTWYNIKAEVTESTIKYFINDIQVFEGSLINNLDFTGLRFVHDNYGGGAYIDNLRINDEQLSIDNQALETISIYPNPTSDFINVKIRNTNTVDKVSMVDLLGKKVEVKLFNNVLDVSKLSNGVYFLTLVTADGITTKKIIKN